MANQDLIILRIQATFNVNN